MKHISKILRSVAACCAVVMLLPLAATVSADNTVTPALSLQLMGDVNGDGAVDTTDARLILQHAVGKEVGDFVTDAADADTNGNVDTTDARLVLQHAVGKAVVLSPQPLPFEKHVSAEMISPAGEAVAFTVREAGRDDYYTRWRYDYSFGNVFAVARTSAEWSVLRELYGFASVYDDEFFAQNAVITMDIIMSNYNEELAVRGISRNGGTLQISLETFYEHDYRVPTLYRALAVVELPREILTDADSLALYLKVG